MLCMQLTEASDPKIRLTAVWLIPVVWAIDRVDSAWH